MTRLTQLLIVSLPLLLLCRGTQAEDESLQENQCVACHGTPDLWEGETQHLYVDMERLAEDVHWQKGIRCVDCHGGNANTFQLREAHDIEGGFRKIESPDQEPDFCGRCHADAQYMQPFQPEADTAIVERFWSSVHGRHLKSHPGPEAANCSSCHPKHAVHALADSRSSVSATNLSETCGTCHREPLVELRKGVHSGAGDKDERGAGTLLNCAKYHDRDMHGLLPVKDLNSPVYLHNQVQLCGNCHESKLATFQASVHGQGLIKSGLILTAVCADCHGAHGIFYAPDTRSTLHRSKVAATCGQCHRFIEQRLAASVHAETSKELASIRGGRSRRTPSCTDCHQGHDQFESDSRIFRENLPNRCGNCHADIAQSYRMSLHGELTQIGYAPAAKCSDCHTAHDILPASNPHASTAPGRRVETCRQCHFGVSAAFADFDPHASHKDKAKYPGLYRIHVATQYTLNVLIAVFLIHSALWFIRSLVQTLQHGRHRRLASADVAVLRFQPMERAMYVVLLVGFLGLVLTGVPLQFSHQPWAHRLADGLGGFETTRVWHHFFGLTLLVAGVAYLFRGLLRTGRRHREGQSWGRIVFGPDSPVFNGRDLRDLGGMLRWFVGLGKKPRFERWTYWEKFDYWALLVVGFLIAFSGLALWFPNVFSQLFTGRVLNVAKLVHSEVPLTLGGILFVMHVFNTHLRPEKFPLDLSLFTGLVSEDHLLQARPEFLDRLRREGRLEEIRTMAPGKQWLRRMAWVGMTILSVGLLLLIAILLANIGE